MKKIISVAAIAASIFLTTTSAQAYVYVNGYTKSNGTYVSPHIRTSPDGYCFNNFSGC